MEFLSSIKELIPDYAKDIRLNVDGTIARSSLQGTDAVGVALAAAYAAKATKIVTTIRSAGVLSPEETNAALTAAALMGSHAIGRDAAALAEARDTLAAYLAGTSDDPGAWPGLDVFAAARHFHARHGAILLPFQAAAEAALLAARETVRP